MIEVQGLSKFFNGVQILHDIDAKFERGKVNLIIGKSGSGKSVLVKSIVGLHHPEKGKVLFDGEDVTDYSFEEMNVLRQSIGMLFQGGALFDSQTVEENVKFPLTMFKEMPQKEMVERANECLEQVNLDGTNEFYPSETSGGMQKRIALARAISMNPQYLFVDEPNSGLDPITANVIDKLIQSLTYRYNTTTVVVTHDMNSVLEIGDNILFIHEGHVHWQGNKSNILESDNPELNDFVYASEFIKSFKRPKS
jgi:phospholipid/cholesterol/gamma-HCH transport system ATP-binding protein